MFKQLVIGIFAMSAVMILWTEANAGCTTINGKRVCASWITGSEICNVAIYGVTSADLDSNGEVTVTCEVDEPTAGQGIPGTLFCAPPTLSDITAASTATDECKHVHTKGAGHENETPGHEGDCSATPFTLTTANSGDTLPLIESSGITQCDSKGVCKTTLEIDPQCTTCCPPSDPAFSTFTNFVTFTANQFEAVAQVSIGGDCARIRELCTLQGTNRYDCVLLSVDECVFID